MTFLSKRLIPGLGYEPGQFTLTIWQRVRDAKRLTAAVSLLIVSMVLETPCTWLKTKVCPLSSKFLNAILLLHCNAQQQICINDTGMEVGMKDS